MRAELVTDFERLRSFSNRWDEIVQSGGASGGVFQSWAFAEASWIASPPGQLRLCCPVIFDGDDVIGFLPIVLRESVGYLMGEPMVDYNGLIAAGGREAAVLAGALRCLLEAPFSWRRCVLRNVPHESALLEQARQGPGLSEHLQIVMGLPCAALVGPAALQKASRTKSLTRAENLLKRCGSVRYRRISDRPELVSQLTTLFDMHVARRGLEGSRSLFLDDSNRRMWLELARRMDPAGNLHFSVVELDGRPVALHLGFQHRDTLFIHTQAFDVNLWNEGPGKVLLRRLFAYAHQQGLNEVDFTIGAEPYKSRYANTSRQTCDLHIDRYPRRPVVQLQRITRHLRDRVRRDPTAAHLARKALSRGRTFAETLMRPSHIANGFARQMKRVLNRRDVVVLRAITPVEAGRSAVGNVLIKELGLLRLQHRLPDAETRACIRRILEGDELRLAGHNDLLFWVRQQGMRLCIEDGPFLIPASRSQRADALRLVLGMAEPGQEVQVVTRNRIDWSRLCDGSFVQVCSARRIWSLFGSAASLTRPLHLRRREGDAK